MDPLTQTPDYAAAVRTLAHASVLVIGDAMLDRFAHGAVHRQSIEAPRPRDWGRCRKGSSGRREAQPSS